VIAHLSDVAIVRGAKGTIYQCGRFPCTAGDWFVAVAITSAGNQSADSILQAALADFRDIDLAFFVGIAGSVKDDVGIGQRRTAIYSETAGKCRWGRQEVLGGGMRRDRAGWGGIKEWRARRGVGALAGLGRPGFRYHV